MSEEYFDHARVIQVLDQFSNLKISDTPYESKDVRTKLD